MADEHDLWQLIAAPIVAFNEAEAANGARFVELLTDYAFLPDADAPADVANAGAEPATRPLRLRELTFQLERRNELGKLERRNIRVPLFQFLPLGGVSIDRARLNYSLSMHPAPTPQPAAPRLRPAPARPGGTLPRLAGTLARRADSTGGEAGRGNVEVEIELKQMDLPAGILELIQQTHGGVTTVHDGTPPEGGTGGGTENGGSGTWPAESIFRVELLRTSPPALVPGKPFRARTRISLNPDVVLPGMAVVFEATAQPRGSLRLIGPGPLALVGGDRDVEYSVEVSKQVERYRASTQVGLRITATIDGTGMSHSEFVAFPRTTD